MESKRDEFGDKLEEAGVVLYAIDTVLWSSTQFPVIARIIDRMFDDEILFQLDLEEFPWVAQYLSNEKRTALYDRWVDNTGLEVAEA